MGMPNDVVQLIREWLVGRSFYVQVRGCKLQPYKSLPRAGFQPGLQAAIHLNSIARSKLLGHHGRFKTNPYLLDKLALG